MLQVFFFFFLVGANVLILTKESRIPCFIFAAKKKKNLQIKVFISQTETDSVFCIY